MELNCVIAIVDRGRAEKLLGLYRGLELPLINVMLGRGTATKEHLAFHDLTETPKTIIYGVCDGEKTRELIKTAKRELYIDIPGNGIMMSVPVKSVGGGRTFKYMTENMKKETGAGAPGLKFDNELIVVILNEGYSNDVMDAARLAGATGGTVLHAKGGGGAAAEKFYGVSFAPEKDVCYIVASSKKKSGIMRSITANSGPGTKAGAICFSLPITEIAGIRAFEEEEQ